MKLALGTVQFGLNYGIGNIRGQVPLEEVVQILDLSRQNGVDTLDTAAAYGDSENRLGQAGVGDFKIVSKIPPLPKDVGPVAEWIRFQAEQSSRKLGVLQIYGLLLHNAADLVGPHADAIYAALRDLKVDGLVRKIGLSIYSPSQLSALPDRYELDLIQAPFNAVDRQLESSGWLRRLKLNGVEVHARSVFLQGVLLMPHEKRLSVFGKWRNIWSAWEDWLDRNNLSALEGALGVVGANSQIDRVVVGVDDVGQLRQILSASSRRVDDLPMGCVTSDPNLINPSRWNTN